MDVEVIFMDLELFPLGTISNVSLWETQLGLGNSTRNAVLKKIISLNVVSVSCGKLHTVALTLQSDIYIWGWNSHDYFSCIRSPQKLQLSNIHSIKCGGRHTIALTNQNEIYVWGKNNHGQLGVNGDVIDTPTKLILY